MAEQKQSVQSPPEPEISIRTMASDLKSIEQSGGQAPSAEIINIQFKVRPEEAAQAPAPGMDFGVVGYSGPEKGIFSPGGLQAAEPKVSLSAEEGKNKTGIVKIILITFGILILIAAFGFFSYYAVSTWIFPAQMPGVK
ncbi:MAG: hypothetical protein NTW60_03730 [Candidatus Wolfebacteria bacterium]|nr:hypothetical protein [Candidatus Wolfebacteria bacterium]